MGLKMRTALYASVLGAVMLTSPALVSADTVTIDNSVSVTAKTGGNAASGGSSSGIGMDGEDGNVVEGTTHVSVSAQTIVNGEVVDDISKEEDGVSEVHLTQEVKYQNGETSTHTELVASPKESGESEAESSVEDTSVLSEDMQGRDEEQQKPSLFSAIKNFFKHVFSIFHA